MPATTNEPFEIRRIVGIPDRRAQRLALDERHALTLHVARRREEAEEELRVGVATPEALMGSPEVPAVLSDRGLLVVSSLEWSAIREYLQSLVRRCEGASLQERLAVLRRYFVWRGEDSPAAEASLRAPPRRQRLELRGIDPPWQNSGPVQAFHLTFGVGRGDEPEAELSVRITTPEGLRAGAVEGQLVLAHRAVVVMSAIDWELVRSHLATILARCEAPTLEHALPLLQRHFRLDWESTP